MLNKNLNDFIEKHICGYFLISGVTTNIAGSRGTIRAQTPPSVANISTSFVRGAIPPRTPSPAGTVIPTAGTWMTGSQPVQLIRANIGQAPRTKCKNFYQHKC